LKVKGTARDKNIVREKDNQTIERRDKRTARDKHTEMKHSFFQLMPSKLTT
jgi:hypothetical protein